jgi:MoxR-like ATPase
VATDPTPDGETGPHSATERDDHASTPAAGVAAAEQSLPAELSQALTPLLQLKQSLQRIIRGQDDALEQILVTLLCQGHALLEGVPGTAKTLTVRTLARLLDCSTKRIQFTPDLMPSDIVGTSTFNLKTQSFELRQGPVFCDLLLGDEINRAPAKTQSALLEAMSERSVTIDGEGHPLSPIFTVFATQNPIEFEGTYPLPEAQQDRFLLKIRIDYPARDAERDLLVAAHEGQPADALDRHNITPVMGIDQLQQLQQGLASVAVEAGVLDYVLSIARASREHDAILMGASPRATLALLQASKARALLQGRAYVTPDDVVAEAVPVLGHRLVLTADAEISGEQTQGVLQSILDATDVPR